MSRPHPELLLSHLTHSRQQSDGIRRHPSACLHLLSLLERSSSIVVHHLLERLSPTAVHHLLPNGLLVFFSIDHHPLSYIVFSNDYHIRAYITYYRVAFSFLLPTRLSLCFLLGLMAFPPVSDSDRVSLTLEGEFPRVFFYSMRSTFLGCECCAGGMAVFLYTLQRFVWEVGEMTCFAALLHPGGVNCALRAVHLSSLS